MKTETTAITRNVDELGRIVLPVEYRKALGIDRNSSVKIIFSDDGIVLKPDHPVCVICGEEAEQTNIKGARICSDCIELVKERVKR